MEIVPGGEGEALGRLARENSGRCEPGGAERDRDAFAGERGDDGELIAEAVQAF
jgi:hypothetical protein